MSTWPPKEGLCSPTVSRNATILQTTASCKISAPAATVWSVLIDTAKYSEWNSFAPSVTILSQPGGGKDPILCKDTSFILHVEMGQPVPGHGAGQGGKRVNTQLRVVDISTPEEPSLYIDKATLESDPAYFSNLERLYRISWTTEGRFVKLGMRTERFHEIVMTSDEECEVRTWECHGGMASRAVKWMYQDTLARKFQDWCDGLKKQSEAQWAKETSTNAPAQ